MRVFQKLVYGIYLAVFAAILALMLLVDHRIAYSGRNDNILCPNFMLAAAAVILLGVTALVLRRTKASGRLSRAPVSRKAFYLSMAVLSVVLFAAQVFVCRSIYFLSGWDVGTVRAAVEDMTALGRIEYPLAIWEFNVYPNNVFLLFVLTLLSRAAAALHIDPNITFLVVESLLVNMAVLLAGLTVYELSGSAVLSWVTYGMSAALYGLSPWITIPYSDGYAVVFPILTLYLYVRSRRMRLPLFIRQALVVLPCCVGYLIKPQCVIVLVAIAIILFVDVLTAKGKKLRTRKWTQAGSACAAGLLCICLCAGVSQGAQEYTGMEKNESAAIVPMHYVMMGLNEQTNGAYSEQDMLTTISVSGRQGKTALCASIAKERIAQFGPAGLARHLVKKTLANYNDGTFAWGGEGGFYETVLEAPGPAAEALRSFYYNDGEHYGWFSTGEQFIWLLVLMLGLGGGVLPKLCQREDAEPVILLSLIGVTLFVLIFEARARYLFIYAPFYVIAAVSGLYKLYILAVRGRQN